MNRRTLLKIIISAPLACLLKPLAAKAEQVWVKMILDRALKNMAPVIPPVEIDGKEYFIAMMHPQQEYDLRVINARDKYKQDRWLVRYNRWLARQGKPPFVPVEGEYFEWKGEPILMSEEACV